MPNIIDCCIPTPMMMIFWLQMHFLDVQMMPCKGWDPLGDSERSELARSRGIDHADHASVSHRRVGHQEPPGTNGVVASD